MYARYELCSRTIVIIILQKELPCLLVQRGFRIGVNQKTLDSDKDVGNAVCRLPILLEGIHADLTR